MFCSHCGIKIEGSPSHCPNCGEELHAAKPKSKLPLWLRILIGVGILGFLLALFMHLANPDPADAAKDQIMAISNHKLTEAYYDYTSSSFQKATSLEKFKEVIKTMPMLTNVKNIDITDQKTEGDITSLKLNLVGDHAQKFKMDYQLENENGEWKVNYFKVTDLTSVSNAEKDPVIEEHLRLLKNNEADKAWKNTTSKEFQTATDLKSWKDFVKSYPILSQYKTLTPAETTLEQDGSSKTVTYILHAADDDEAKDEAVEFSLEKENGTWKIRGLKLLVNSPEELKSPLSTEQEAKVNELLTNFVDLLKQNDFKKAYFDATSPGFKQETNLKEFENVISTYNFFTKNTKKDLQYANSVDPITSYKGIFTADDGEQGEAQFDLIQDGDAWKIEQILIFKEAPESEVSSTTPLKK